MSQRAFVAVRSAFYATVFFGLWGWLALFVRRFDGALGLSLPTWTPVVSILVMTFGFALTLACVSSFAVEGRGTPAPVDPPRELVTAGPYRWVRNPMYLGGFAMLLGFALMHRSLAMALLAVGFLGFFHLFVVWYEEPHLGRKFGDAYLDYRRDARRWIPRRPLSR